MKYAFAGDREVSVTILKYLTDKGYGPEMLLLPCKNKASHSNDLIKLSGLKGDNIIFGNEFESNFNINKLKSFDLDYIIGIHFPYIISSIILNIPKIGFLNLHPSFLPYNKGWHTPSWAILDKKPYGATLHFMSKELDGGDIILQKQIEVLPNDTANSLYKRVLDLEIDVFIEALPKLLTLNPIRIKQVNTGTSHSKKDIKDIQRLVLSENLNTSVLLDRLRALTTNNIQEATYFEINNKKYAVQLHIEEII